MLNCVKKFVTFYKSSLYAHHNQFEVTRHGIGPPFELIQKCYLLSLVLYTISVLCGTLGLECESRPVCDPFDWSSLATSPYYFYHQMLPKVVWKQVNPMSASVLLFTSSCWLVFMFNPPIEKRFLIGFDLARDEQTKAEIDKICAFRRKLLKLAFLMEKVVLASGTTFGYVHVLFINSVYNVKFGSILFWAFLNPLNLYYSVHFIFMVPFYVILASQIITIQQKAISAKLSDIIAKLANPKSSRIVQHRLWWQYIGVQTEISSVCKHLCEYARFWSPYLTALIIAFISIQCYVLYVVLFIPVLSPVLRLLLSFIMSGLVIDELLLIGACALVVDNFKRISAQNRTFYRLYSGVPILVRNLIKAETLQNSRQLHSYAFRLFGNYRITSKSFYYILSYISVFFLFIMKDRH